MKKVTKTVVGNSKQVRVSNEVWEHIQKQARPLIDTTDSVLRRVFKLPPKRGKVSSERNKGNVNRSQAAA